MSLLFPDKDEQNLQYSAFGPQMYFYAAQRQQCNPLDLGFFESDARERAVKFCGWSTNLKWPADAYNNNKSNTKSI